MKQGPLAELLIERFETMPRQLQMASRYVLDHPDDVALISMREQANRAGVSHSTMMRLARTLGLKSYEDIRALYARELRNPHAEADFTTPIGIEGVEQGVFSRVGSMSDTLAAQVASLGEYISAKQLLAAGDTLAGARRLFCLGVEAEHAAAHYFAHALSLLGEDVALLDSGGGTGVGPLRHAGEGDAILVIGLEPYARVTVEVARKAVDLGVTLVAVTDSPVSPLARAAHQSLIVTARSQSGFCSVVPAIAAVELLAGLIADQRGIDVEGALSRAKKELAAFEVYWKR
ncbi:MurR/RpiR family transcriptional regulator [uncultured Nitratireductor sp.]|uniref:MurR/RpiR family transcriptional regulator n=1 Tax=uncultured Nitratireductor sp. TaxID=520953 RepID=UPI0025EC3100|nr:MurR/RpiR family transcriptional regulator [uncultured Nitratireductor sp.]